MTCLANKIPKPTKDMMWYFLMMGGQKSNIPALEESVNELCTATMQKNAGQRPFSRKTDIDWQNLDDIMWRIVLEATALVLSGELNKLRETV